MPEPDRMLTNKDIYRRYGITQMCLWRWRRDPEIAFPQPDAVVKRRSYWNENKTIVPWERASVTKRMKK